MTTRSRSTGFSLLEIIVALGVFSIGATAAFALLVAAAAAGRRAEHEVQAALIAETVLDDIRLDVSRDFDLEDYPVAPPAAAEGAEAAGEGVALEEGAGGSTGQDPDGAETRYLVEGGTWSAYPDYTYDVALTPLPGPDPDRPWSFLVEVEVRWTAKGQARAAVYSTVVVRRATHAQNPGPTRR